MRVRIGRWFDGLGLFIGPAIALFVLALLVVVLELNTPEILLWTGHRVVGAEQGGIVFYRWHGQNYSLDAPGYGSSKTVSVFIDPGDANNAVVDNLADRAFVGLLIGGPVAVGVALIATGLIRRTRSRRRRKRGGPRPAIDVLDTDVAARNLRDLRGGPRDGQ
jgi:hypothetical protein